MAGLHPFQLQFGLFHTPKTSNCVAERATPPLNAGSVLLTEGVTYIECVDVRYLSGVDTLSDKTGSVAANVTLALIPW